jgi:choline transporter-like protein 2/4/5
MVKLVRVLLEYIDRKLKKTTHTNKIVKYLLCCLKCCFFCFEKIIKFLNRNSYIITAIYGYNFCQASRKAVKVVLNNVMRVAVADKITNFIMLLSKLAITLLIGVFALFFVTKRIPSDQINQFAPDLHYYFLPVIAIVVGVYIIAKVFFDVFEMCVDTLFLCVMIDLEINDGTQERHFFMSKNLKKLLVKC